MASSKNIFGLITEQFSLSLTRSLRIYTNKTSVPRKHSKATATSTSLRSTPRTELNGFSLISLPVCQESPQSPFMTPSERTRLNLLCLSATSGLASCQLIRSRTYQPLRKKGNSCLWKLWSTWTWQAERTRKLLRMLVSISLNTTNLCRKELNWAMKKLITTKERLDQIQFILSHTHQEPLEFPRESWLLNGMLSQISGLTLFTTPHQTWSYALELMFISHTCQWPTCSRDTCTDLLSWMEFKLASSKEIFSNSKKI